MERGFDFCQLRDGRLPTEAEWEYAARGPKNFIYPWGNDWDPNIVVWDNNSGGKTAEVGTYEDNASWVGALDMSGNVWEWVSSLFMEYPYNEENEDDSNVGGQGVTRGGAAPYFNPNWLRADFRSPIYREFSDGSSGFRCVRDYDES